MAISRKRMLELGVSYGSGGINFGNDVLAYERELRAFPDDGRCRAMFAAIDAADGAAALEAARAFRELCGKLAMSGLYVALSPIVGALEADCLPAADEVARVRELYEPLAAYLSKA